MTNTRTTNPTQSARSGRTAKQRFTRRVIWLFVTLLVAGTIAVPAAYVILPHVRRWEQIRNLTSPDLKTREYAMAYVATLADDDPRVLDGAISQLGVEDRDNFLHIVRSLDHAGKWRHPPVPADPWLRWIEMLSKADDDENARIIAAQKLADAPDLAGDPRTLEALKRLLKDPQPDVRYNALVSAAELAGKSKATGRETLVNLFAPITSDSEDEIARQAWLFLGLLREAGAVGYEDKQLRDPLIGQAIIWAQLRSRPDQPSLALDALESRIVGAESSEPQPDDAADDPATSSPPAFDPQLQAMAVYALQFTEDEHAEEAVAAIYPADHPFLADWKMTSDDLLIWRAALVAPYREQWQHDLETLRRSRMAQQIAMHDSMPAILRARYSKIGPYVATFEEAQSHFAIDPLMSLAWSEGVLQLDQTRPIHLRANAYKVMPPMVRLFATAAAESPDPLWIRDLFGQDQATLRDLACVVAADRFTDDQLDALVLDLLGDYNDNAKMAGGILAGLTGKQTDQLIESTLYEDIWSVKQVLRLGLWMQGLEPEMDNLAPALLTREDLPTTTILLAMLEKGRPEALEYLLTPRGDERTLSPFALGLAKRQRFITTQDTSAFADQATEPDAQATAASLDSVERDDNAGPDAAAPAEAQHPAKENETADPVDNADQSADSGKMTAADMLKPAERITLVRLLDELRWWYVLNRYLPEDAPRFDVWGDPLLMQFQVDTLRNWYLLNRPGNNQRAAAANSVAQKDPP